jgi:hypothetical protein
VWGLYRQFFDRFNFANHTYDTGSFGGHINAELIPKTLELQVYGAYGALGRFTATPFPDATLAQDGTIMPLTISSAMVGLIWHTLPTLDIYSYAGFERAKAAFSDVGTVPFGYGNPLYNNTAATKFAGGDLQRQYLGSAAIHRRILRYDHEGLLRHGQSRRAVFLQPALRVRGRRRRSEDGRQYRHDPDPVLSLLKWLDQSMSKPKDETNEVLVLGRIADVAERAGFAVAGAVRNVRCRPAHEAQSGAVRFDRVHRRDGSCWDDRILLRHRCPEVACIAGKSGDRAGRGSIRSNCSARAAPFSSPSPR